MQDKKAHTHTQSSPSPHLIVENPRSKQNRIRTILVSITVVVFHKRDVGLLRPTVVLEFKTSRHVTSKDVIYFDMERNSYAMKGERNKIKFSRAESRFRWIIKSKVSKKISISIIKVKGNSAQVFVLWPLFKNNSIMLHNKHSETFNFRYAHHRQSGWRSSAVLSQL